MRRDPACASMESLEDRDEPKLMELDHELSPSTVVSEGPHTPGGHSFFTTDWLEQVDGLALSQSKTLKTPSKAPPKLLEEGDDDEDKPVELGVRLETVFGTMLNINPAAAPSFDNIVKQEETKRDTTPPPHPTSVPRRKIANKSPFFKKSSAIAAGWNAKGCQKAKSGLFGDALLCFENALDIRTSILGEQHADVANTLNNMGISLGRLGKHKAAMVALHRALKIRTTKEAHLEIAATLHNIGNIYAQMNDYEGALSCFQKAWGIQQALPESDILVARTVTAIGHLNFESQEYAKALSAYCSAKESFQRAGLKEGHGEYESILLDIADTQDACNETDS